MRAKYKNCNNNNTFSFFFALVSLLNRIINTYSFDICPGGQRPQENLRFNVSSFKANDVLLIGEDFPEEESLVEAVCCDPFFVGYAEPKYFFARKDVAFFFNSFDDDNEEEEEPKNIESSTRTGKRSSTIGTTTHTYFDPICGIPLFIAPVGRSREEFEDDTMEHGWPSFRQDEVVKENVFLSDNGRIVFSKCGTRLGTYEPDFYGPRYCLDVACISGNPSASYFSLFVSTENDEKTKNVKRNDEHRYDDDDTFTNFLNLITLVGFSSLRPFWDLCRKFFFWT